MSESATGTSPAVRRPTLAAGAVPAAPHVLVADGNDRSRDAREQQLRTAGFRVSVARTGFEAIVKASCHVPDMILLDESLADIEATETGRLLTTCPVTSHIPVVRLLHGGPLPQRVLSRLKRAMSSGPHTDAVAANVTGRARAAARRAGGRTPSAASASAGQ
jgi:CheY-like chemotaxis protein